MSASNRLILIIVSLFLFGDQAGLACCLQVGDEIKRGNSPIHCPDRLLTTASPTVDVGYSAMTLPKVSYPEFVEDFPLTEKIVVIFLGETDHQDRLWKELSLPLLTRGKCSNSLEIVHKIRMDDSFVWNLARQSGMLRLQDTEDYFVANLTKKQTARIDRLYFWKLIRRDGIMATFAGNIYLYRYLQAEGLEFSQKQLNEIKGLADELHREAVEVEQDLLDEYIKITIDLLPDETRDRLTEVDIEPSSLVINYLDLLSSDTRAFFAGQDFNSKRILRKYRCRSFSGTALIKDPEFLAINPESEVAVAFLTQLNHTGGLRESIPTASRANVAGLAKSMQTELSAIEGEFAVRRNLKKDNFVRSLKITEVVEKTLATIEDELSDEDWRIFRAKLRASKIRNIGLDYVMKDLSSERFSQAKSDFQNWLERVDNGFEKLDARTLDVVMSVMTPRQQSRVSELLKERPDWMHDGFSQLRLNLRFKFVKE